MADKMRNGVNALEICVLLEIEIEECDCTTYVRFCRRNNAWFMNDDIHNSKAFFSTQ